MASRSLTYAAYREGHDLSGRECLEMIRQGVRARHIHEPTPIRAGNIRWEQAGRFVLQRPRPKGEHTPTTLAQTWSRAFLFLVEDDDSLPLDVIAWQAAAENRIGSLYGAAWGLGQETALAPRLDHNLLVHRDPLNWLRAGRRGVVILLPRLAVETLIDAEPLQAEDERHGLELREALTRRTPRIVVPAIRRAAA